MAPIERIKRNFIIIIIIKVDGKEMLECVKTTIKSVNVELTFVKAESERENPIEFQRVTLICIAQCHLCVGKSNIHQVATLLDIQTMAAGIRHTCARLTLIAFTLNTFKLTLNYFFLLFIICWNLNQFFFEN